MHKVRTYNAISTKGLDRLPTVRFGGICEPQQLIDLRGRMLQPRGQNSGV